MANRNFTQFGFTMERQVVSLFAHITFGAAGASTLDTANSKGIVSVTHDGTGLYTLVFGTQAGMLDVYNKLLAVNLMWDASANSGTAPLAKQYAIAANSVATFGTCSLQIKLFAANGSAVDPASTEGVYIAIALKNSTAP